MFDFRFADVAHVSWASLLTERSTEDSTTHDQATDDPATGLSQERRSVSGESPAYVADTSPDETPDAADDSPHADGRADFLPWSAPSELFANHVSYGQRSVVWATSMGRALPQLSGAELKGALEDVDLLRARTETLTLHIVLAAMDRRVHSDNGLSLREWVTQRCPFLSPHQIGDLVTVAQGVGDPEHTSIAAQVFAAQLPLRRAAAVLRALGRVKPILDTTPYADTNPDAHTDFDADSNAASDSDSEAGDSSGVNEEATSGSGTDAQDTGMGVSAYQDAVHLMLGVAAQARFNDRDLRRVTDRLTNTVLPDKDHENRAKAARSMRCVNESSLADGSLVRFVVTCDPEGAAVIRSVLNSPLAAPSPDETGPDPRTAGQRRYDALMTVVRRGIAGGDQMPTTPKATMNVTVRWDALLRALVGAGETSTGEVLTPATVRRVACDADVVPMVLGTDGEILDQGRAKRLVTPGQRRALEHRDKGCTFPGCSIPASWTDAHHVIHWSRGGLSNLNNYALLCGRHHTIVHDKDLMATVRPTGVTWLV